MSAESTAFPLADYPRTASGSAFDRIAEDYDQIFTDSLIGRAQRDSVWKVLTKTFREHDHVLELNCGTGEDAIFLAGKGISVFACDASRQMIARAEQRLRHISSQLPAVFCELPIERLRELQPKTQFDGAFSNFSGLNCVADLSEVASSLSHLVKRDGRLVLCFSTRFCLIEILHYLVLGQWRKAFRRCKGHTRVTLDDVQFTVYYPTIRQIRRSFAPYFSLYSYTGVGVAVPPSYLERWARRHPDVFRFLRRLEGLVARLPILRSTGDHVLLCFERVSG
ncbi:SAM-dependent methyltransferase [Acidisarcina polymorpha]|uniref:SAM-dependent methyltransferase n=1 Tax=Acidisarcina polymorpha TaxID=2211140 RepID=A0A2Z5G1Q2_9BACT|nr:methyltransferase [Acidisarcina polymorpha]AXC13031.1 SAM-dependent methyltransferase [Acidisarcina polymorpha]